MPPQKINLYLHVGPPETDGYHLLESLLVFSDVGDRVSLEEHSSFSLSVRGKFSHALGSEDDNLVLRAARAWQKRFGGPSYHLILEKNLPVSSGLGGGSADAAAVLRGLAHMQEISSQTVLKTDIPLSLGADVPACFISAPLRARGYGEHLTLYREKLSWPAVLVNPLFPVSTPEVFKLYDVFSPSVLKPLDLLPSKNIVQTLRETTRNDLERPAKKLFPVLHTVKKALLAQKGQCLVRLSGSGASMFALFENDDHALLAKENLKYHNPAWWITSCYLGGPELSPKKTS